MFENFSVPDNMGWIAIAVGVIVMFLREFAWVEARKRFLPYLAIVLGVGGALVMRAPFPDCITQGIMIGLMAAGGYDALRAVKDKLVKGTALWLMVLLLLPLAGCGGWNVPPEQAQRIERSAIVVAELDARCRDGDAAACRDGLAEAAETLRLVVEGMHGTAAPSE